MQNTTAYSKSKKNFLEVARQSAKIASKVVLSALEKNFSLDYKKGREVVTQADKDSEEAIIKNIKKHFPDHSFWSEERPEEKTKSKYRWVIDPIDGTHLFTRGIPTFGISIGLEENGKPIVAVCAFPKLNLEYTAEKGKGAYCNGSKISVSTKTKKDQLMYITSSGMIRHPELMKPFLKDVRGRNVYLRDFGSTVYALCLVAHGKADAALEYSIKPGDVAAGILLVREAGGRVTNAKGKAATSLDKNVIASNSKLHKYLI